MNRRFVATLIVALAVLFGQGGGLVLAAICPHLRSEQQPEDNACHANSQEVVAEHHESPETKGDAFQTNEPDVRCNHCVVHSRNKREESALQQTNTSQRANDPKVAITFAPVGPSLLKNVAPFAKAHGPPLVTAPLYLFVNVFRI
jgi:hypothetical protein